MTTNRKIRRRKEQLAKKMAKKANKQVSEKLDNMPKKCDECGAPFVKGDESCLGWKIAVYDDGPIHLVCTDCVPDNVS